MTLKRHRPSHHNKLKAVFIGVEDAPGGVGILFVAHLKKRFRDKTKVSVKHHPCDGGSYADMLRVAKRASCNEKYDRKLMVWDADRFAQGRDKIPSAGKLESFESILLSPCVEGVLLELLGERVPKGSHGCKRALRCAISPFDCIEKFHQKLDRIPDETFRGHPAVSQILSAINPPAPSAAHAYTAHTA
jgi:hypothetical protein